MSETILSYVLSNLPEEWEKSTYKNRSYKIFSISRSQPEYQMVESYFHLTHVRRIDRVQNPFQFGRYMLRREMLQTTYEDIVFHPVHKDDLETALKFNCDYRRYLRRNEGIFEDGHHPMFYHSFSDLKKYKKHNILDLKIVILKILTNVPKTQCDYYIDYVVHF